MRCEKPLRKSLVLISLLDIHSNDFQTESTLTTISKITGSLSKKDGKQQMNIAVNMKIDFNHFDGIIQLLTEKNFQ